MVVVEQDVVDFIGGVLTEADSAVSTLTEESAQNLLKASIGGLQAVLDNAIRTIDNESPHLGRRQLVYDADDYDPDRPDDVPAGTPATPEDMVRRAGSEFSPLAEVRDADLDEVLGVIRTALLDVRCTLLELSETDIEELAQATLIVARIALGYARAAHAQLAHAVNANGANGANANASDATSNIPPYKRRALWEPLTPQLWAQAGALAEQGKQRPATALAVLTAMLPFVWVPVVLGPPLLVTDAVVQWGVGTSLGQRADQTAAEVLQVAHLWLLLAKVSARQSLRLARVEFDRMGGVFGIASASARAITDPIHTAKNVWSWSQLAVAGAGQQVTWFRSMMGYMQGPPQC